MITNMKMLPLTAFVALMAIRGSVASPLKPRNPDEVVVYKYITVADVITVTAPTVQVTLHENVVVTDNPVVVVVTNTVPLNGGGHAPTANAAPVATTLSSQQVPKVTGPSSTAVDSKPSSKVTSKSETTPVPAPSTTPAQPASTAEPSPTDNSLPTNSIDFDLAPTQAAYKQLVLFSHNVHRQNHTNTNDLVYNSTLESYAKEKAESCLWNEDLPDDANAAHAGMNMAEGTYIGAPNITSIISDMWYNGELPLYPGFGIANPDMTLFDAWGHFTQVVWRDTTSVGCWSSACDRDDGTANQIGAGFFTVCMYWPPANYPGQYAAQVGTPEGHPSVFGV